MRLPKTLVLTSRVAGLQADVRLEWPAEEQMAKSGQAPPSRASQLVGVFGDFGSLTLSLPPGRVVSQVLAQDLLAEAAEDITSRVHINGSVVEVDGNLVREVGTAARSSGDVSEPGLVLLLRLAARVR